MNSEEKQVFTFSASEALSKVLIESYYKSVIHSGENEIGSFCDFFGGDAQLSGSDCSTLENLLSRTRLGFYKVYSLSGIVNQEHPDAQRVVVLSCATPEELDQRLHSIEEAKLHDHSLIGAELELFFIDSHNMPGVVNWLPKGAILLNRVKSFIAEIMSSDGYREVMTPFIAKKMLWETSGHWELFRKNIFAFQEDNEYVVIKPMSCPCHINIFKKGNNSYRDLPYKLREFGFCSRNESSGALDRLFRLRSFTQDDAHVFCSHEQIESVVSDFIRMLKNTYLKFGFEEISISLSTRPEQFHGRPEEWEVSENVLSSVAKKSELSFKVEEGEGAFYGPKLDFHIRDKRGRLWQCGTVQLDFFLAERFGAEYSDSDGKRKSPVIVHHAILGSLERFIGIMIENYKGAFPIWLAPTQVSILSLTEEVLDYCHDIKKMLAKDDFISEIDSRNESISHKIASAHSKKIPILLIVGKSELNSVTVSVRFRGKEGSKAMALSEMLETIKNLRVDGKS
jgi:threonyl-tRNA synthetase